jgi:ATP-binding cassette, subfamily C (CFTR/MRP), member 4
VTFVLLASFTLFCALVRSAMFFKICLNATGSLFEKMLHGVFRSPMQFFNENPHGRLMNRFSKDISLSDEMLPWTFFDFIQCSFMVNNLNIWFITSSDDNIILKKILGTLTISVIVIPWVLIVVPIVAIIFYYLREYYLATSRQIKRQEAITRSPVYSTIPATLEGLSTIRAFQSQSRFRELFMNIQDENTRIFFCFLSSARWLGFRLDAMASSLLAIVAFLCVGIQGGSLGLGPGAVGFVLSYILQLVGLLQWAVRQSSEVINLFCELVVSLLKSIYI